MLRVPLVLVAIVLGTGCLGDFIEGKAGPRNTPPSKPTKVKNPIPPPPPPTVSRDARDGFVFVIEYWLPSGREQDIASKWYPTSKRLDAAVMFVIDGPPTDIYDIVVETTGDEWRPRKQFTLGAASPSAILELPTPAQIKQLKFRFSDPKTTSRLLLFLRQADP